MAALAASQKTYLHEVFGPRVTFDRVERKIYSHDIGEVPGLIKPLMGKTLAESIVQPQSEEELVDLVEWARANRIALTPRGKATSGYGGVLPLKRGIVVDFYRMNGIISIDREALTAVVQPGAVWEKLQKLLEKEGLMLRLYPTSFMASTVGGWLAQGGSGVGSYEAGWFRSNVLSARVVLPTGEVRQFAGEDLDMVSDAEGITGLISEVTIKVQPFEELEVVAIESSEARDLQALIEGVTAKRLPVWQR